MKKLPDNNKFTFNYCSRFSRIFEFDAKYIPVKGYKNELAFLWGIDYFRHDFPIILLAHSESYQAWAKFCEYFKILNHTPDYIVCDDNSPLKISARYKFPDVKVQTCYNHFKEGIRKSLRVRSDDTYRKFSQEIDIILSKKRSSRDFDFLVHRALLYYMDDPVCRSIIVNLGKRKEEFLAFTGIKNAPVTTNMIEGFNQQLEDRLKPVTYFFDEKFKSKKYKLTESIVTQAPKDMLAFSLGKNANKQEAIKEARQQMENWYKKHNMQETTKKSFTEWWEGK